MSLNKKLIPDLLLVGINQVIDRTTAATSFVLQGVRAIFDPSNPQNTELYYRDDAGGEHYFPSSEKLADPSAGDDIGINAAGVTATKLNPALAELKATGGTPSQGVSGIINLANGSGGWIAMDGNPPLNVTFFYDNSIGVLSFTGASLFTTTNLESTNYVYISNDLGGLQFRDNSKNYMAGISIDKDTVGAGLHDLTVSGQNRFYVSSSIYIDTIDPGTDTNKVMLVQDTNTNKVEQRPLPSGVTVGGLAGEILTSDGSGGITALGVPNKFGYDSVLGYVNSPSTPLGATGFIASNGFFYFNCATNNLSEFQFRDNSGSSFGKLIGNSTLGTLLINGFNEFSIGDPLKILSSTTLTPIQVSDPGTDTNKVMLVMDSTSGDLEKRPMPTSGSASQGAQYDFNFADGSGGWTALDGSSFPRLYLDSATNVIKYQSAIEGSRIVSNFSLDLNYDSGTLQYNDTAGTTLLAEIKIIKDSLGAGLHELKVFTAKRFTVNQDFRVNGQTSMPALVDNGTNTGKKMLVIDTTSKEVEERPIPSSTDVDAIHTNVAGEIFSLTTKTSPSVDDVLVIEDSADSNNKKRILVSSLRGGIDSFTNPSGIIPNALTTKQINANAQAQSLSIGLPTNGYDGAKMIYRIRATTTSTLSWDVNFNDLRGVLPTSAPINKTIYVGVIYDGYSSTWDVVSVVEQT